MRRSPWSPTVARRILIADDDEAILEGLCLILEEEGYEVLASTTGPTVATVLDHRPALIFLDVWMSGLDGRDACRALKAEPRTRHVPVILASANADAHHFAAECGADDVLHKPFELDEVLRLADRYTSRATPT